MYRHLVIAIAALGIGSGAASGQPPRTAISTGTQARIGPVLPDLVAFEEVFPAIIMESYSDANPCVPHTHTRTAYVRIKGRFGASIPAPTAILYHGTQPMETWTLTVPPGNQQVTLGTFTWTFDHPCPSGGSSVSNIPPQPHNYRLVVDPSAKLTEMSESNNEVTFYILPTVPFVRAP